MGGSSPRMRGTHKHHLRPQVEQRIIPAYAGNTSDDRQSGQRTGDHPRVCGEHIKTPQSTKPEKGSSPRMRGTHDVPFSCTVGTGIIPAYAGNTNGIRAGLIPLGDHPRVCGEHFNAVRNATSPQGSSPRMRGTLGSVTDTIFDRGIIPAYAGNTSRTYFTGYLPWDHPRVCGEHSTKPEKSPAQQGSSPRMRGTRSRRFHPTVPRRIIPAYAGNTEVSGRVKSPPKDHPRVCGEHSPLMASCLPAAGSSPRMRGTLPCRVRALAARGIIPAYAGNTCRLMISSACPRDHPRVCGEHWTCR